MNSDQLFHLLVNQVWQIVALTVIVWGIVQLVGSKRPHLAHGLWLIVVLKCVTPPIWGHSLGVFSQIQTMLSASEAAASISAVTPMDVESRDKTALSSETIDRLSRGKFIDESDVNFHALAMPISGRPTGTVPSQRVGTTFWGVLAAGALLGFLIVGAKFATCVRRIKNKRVRDFDIKLNDHVVHLCTKLRIRHVPDIIVSDVLFGPAVLGIFRHTIVLPKCLLETGTAERTVLPDSLNLILVHELLHIRRGDLFTGTLQAVVQCLWWFHPAVWFANRMLSRDAERCCDEQVIAELGCGPAEYARSLLSVIESKQPLEAVPVFPGMKPVEITSQRMERIMSLKNGCQKRMPLWNWAIVLGFGLLVLPGAASQNSEPPTLPTIQQPATSEKDLPDASSLRKKPRSAATAGNLAQPQPEDHAAPPQQTEDKLYAPNTAALRAPVGEPTERLVLGSGVNSDAGVIGATNIHQNTEFDDPAPAKDQPTQPGRKLIAIVYNVAELVVPIQDVVGKPDDDGSAVVQANHDSAFESTHAKPLPAPLRVQPISHDGVPDPSSNEVEYDFAPLVELIRTSVAPETWAQEHGPGRIEANRKMLCLVVRQTPQAHDEIVDLLSALQKENDLMVVADSLIVKLPEGQTSDWLDEAVKLNTAGVGLRWALSTDSRTKELLRFVKDVGGKVISSPKITTLPGHRAEISVSGSDKNGQPSCVALSLTARPLSEGNLLRLDYWIGVDEPITNGKGGTALLKSGQTLVVEYTAGSGVQVGVPMLGNLPHVDRLFKNTPDHSGRYLVTITPRLVRADAEKEAGPDDLPSMSARRPTQP